MKGILKKLRAFIPFNAAVRSVIKSYLTFSDRVFLFFSIHWPVSGTISFKLPGGERLKMYSVTDDYVSTQAYWKGYKGYEGPAIHLFYHLSRRASTVIDVGANVGYFTLIGAMANRQAMFHSFEPVERICQRMQHNIRLNSLSNVKANQCAAGNVNEKISFFIPEGAGMALAGSTKKGWTERAIPVTVDSVTLDHYCSANEIQKLDLVKMDCEFHETEVLEGMKNILKRDKPVILSEVLFPESEGVKNHFENSLHTRIESILKENGYYFYLINSTALIRIDHLEYNPDDRNYLFSAKCSEKIYLPYSDMNELLRNIL